MSRPSGELRGQSEDPLTTRSRAIWSSADFHPIARSFAAGAEEFINRLAIGLGERVLDVACGTGNLAIPAAKTGAVVTGVDIAPNLIERARIEARAAGTAIEFDVGDAEALPYHRERFDTTVTMFGAMFANRPDVAVAELVRVTRKGGRVVMANWTPESFVGRMLKAHVAVVKPPAGLLSPLLWGDEEAVRLRFGDRVRALVCTRRAIELRFPFSPAAVTETFATCYGPTVATLALTDAAGALKLRESLTRLFSEHNTMTDGTTAVVGEYLEVLARVG